MSKKTSGLFTGFCLEYPAGQKGGGDAMNDAEIFLHPVGALVNAEYMRFEAGAKSRPRVRTDIT